MCKVSVGRDYRDYREDTAGKFPMCPAEPIPTSIMMDSLLEKDSISNAGSASGITGLKMEKKSLCRGNFSQRKEEREYEKETTLKSARPMHKEKQEMLQEMCLRLPCSPWCRPW